MIHRLSMGHLDPGAVRQGLVSVLRPLDAATVVDLVKKIGRVDGQGQAWLGKAPVTFRDGYVVAPWLGAGRHRAVETFAERLQELTGCLVADIEHREIIHLKATPDSDDPEPTPSGSRTTENG